MFTEILGGQIEGVFHCENYLALHHAKFKLTGVASETDLDELLLTDERCRLVMFLVCAIYIRLTPLPIIKPNKHTNEQILSVSSLFSHKYESMLTKIVPCTLAVCCVTT